MANVIKTQYMDKAQKGYSEYIAKTIEDLNVISPVAGDRALLQDGSLYFCWDKGIWSKIGGE